MSDSSASSDFEHSEIGWIVDEFTDRLNAGQAPDIEQYVAAHPEIAGVLRQVLPSLVALHDSEPAALMATSTRPRRAGSAGSQLGEYHLVREIGRGGMAVVYEATHRQLRRRVALKVLGEHLVDDVFVKRFEREARAAANLHHTHIVPVFETGRADGTHYIAMQFIAGNSIDQALRELRRSRETDVTTESEASTDAVAKAPAARVADTEVPPPEPTVADDPKAQASDTTSVSLSTAPGDDYYRNVARLGLQVADALHHAHRQGVLHRDIKPSNLLLDENNDVWVSDFGLAKTEDDNLTNTGDIIGTLRYMAPERFRGDCDARSDTYGLGVTLYEMLTLRPAFDQVDRIQLIRQVTNDDPPRARLIEPRVPRDLETIVAKAISREADHRYQTARELADDLRRFLEDKPVLAARITLRDRMWRWCRRNPALSSLTAALIASVIVGAALFGWQFRETLIANAELRTTNEDLTNSVAAEQAARDELRMANDGLKESIAAEQVARKTAETNFEVNLAVNEFLTESFRSPDPELDGRTVTLASQLDRAVEGLSDNDEIDSTLRGALLESAGVTYRGLGLTKECINALEKADAAYGEKLDKKHHRRINNDSQLGLAYLHAGRAKDAIALLETTTANARDALGENTKATHLAANHLALALRATGKADRAVEILQPIYDYQMEHVGTGEESTLQTQHNFALCLQATGKLKTAITMFEESVANQSDLHGPTDPRTLTGKSNLAVAYLNNREPAKAAPLLHEVLEHRRDLLGEEHQETFTAENNLAGVYMMSGQIDRAADVFADLLPRMREKLGDDHPNVLGVQYNLAGAYLWLKKPEQALPLFQQSWEQMKVKLGPEHPTTLKSRKHIGRANEDAGNYDEAEAVYRELLDLERKRENAKPTQVAVYLDALGRTLVKKQTHADAEPLLREALSIRDEHIADFWQTAATRSVLGECLAGQKQFEEAEPLLLAGHESLVKLAAKIPPSERGGMINASMQRLVDLYEHWKHREAAAEWRQKLEAASK